MIKYRWDAIDIISYNKKTNEVVIKKIGGGCWSWGCCIPQLTRDITCITDDKNGEEIKAEIRNIIKFGGVV